MPKTESLPRSNSRHDPLVTIRISGTTILVLSAVLAIFCAVIVRNLYSIATFHLEPGSEANAAITVQPTPALLAERKTNATARPVPKRTRDIVMREILMQEEEWTASPARNADQAAPPEGKMTSARVNFLVAPQARLARSHQRNCNSAHASGDGPCTVLTVMESSAGQQLAGQQYGDVAERSTRRSLARRLDPAR